MKAASKKTSGFTLLELLIAMTLLGFILTLLFGGLRLGSRSWDAGDARGEKTTHLTLLQEFLRRELSQVTPYFWKNKANADLAFIGEPNSLMMVAPLAVHLAPGGLFLLGLNPDDGKLVMRQAIPDADSADFSALDDAEKIVLADHVEDVAFAYYGAETKDADPQWTDHWKSQDTPQRLPYLIRVRITFDDGQVWPDLIVAPMIGQYTGCTWDNLANRCVSG